MLLKKKEKYIYLSKHLHYFGFISYLLKKISPAFHNIKYVIFYHLLYISFYVFLEKANNIFMGNQNIQRYHLI